MVKYVFFTLITIYFACDFSTDRLRKLRFLVEVNGIIKYTFHEINYFYFLFLTINVLFHSIRKDTHPLFVFIHTNITYIHDTHPLHIYKQDRPVSTLPKCTFCEVKQE